MPGVEQRPPSQSASVFAARERELALLRATLADAAAGLERFVFVSGEPGIGKTRLG